METITNLAHSAAQTASKAVWGESQSHEEPVSGKMGNVEAGEPYDAGNIGAEPNEAALKSREQKDTERQGTETSASTSMPASEPGKPASGIPGAGPARPHEKGSEETPHREEEARTSEQPSSPAGPAKDAPSAVSMRDDSTKAQNDTRAPAPSSSEESKKQDTITGDIMTGPTIGKPASAQDEGKAKSPAQDDSPDINLAGPGPRPLEDIAREHGGDGGAAKPESVSQSGSSEQGQRAGQEEGVEGHRRRDSGKSLGSEAGEAGEGGVTELAGMGGKGVGGEEYVRSSGLKADGGDFDAARPGAGKEADRLLEEKGVHLGKETGHGQEADHAGKEKHSLKDKIKAKLHKTHMAP
ncbi:hypothetical protein C8A03DRAFT_13643 [Achaetomium macrosporum]|uniref:Glycine-rich cell wall structural protein 1 n=1 Tax=Achaetomium macrosporum TaxID=79813 RepID=A0AAN7HCQ0_9PEZI|nr:hypothetical protein C8A03DRAFT_13643 [Achaetomium macrosporum]